MTLRFRLALLFAAGSSALASGCGEDPQDAGVTGVFDATIALQAGNTSTIRYWFTGDGKWGRARRDSVGGTPVDTCDTPSAPATYERQGNRIVLRYGSTTSERTWTLTEGESRLTLSPPDTFANGTAASAFTRVRDAQTNRDCNSAFQ